MKRKTAGWRSNALIFVLAVALFLGLAFAGCEGSRAKHQAVNTWEMYVLSVKAGNADQARNFWTKESQKYFVLESERKRFWLDQKLTVVKAESGGDVVKLQLLAEKDGQQKGFFAYLVRQDGKYYLQYPFLIFAQSWPTMRSQHFIYHSKALPDTSISELGNQTVFPDSTALEDFLAKIQRLTGAQYPGVIDYYLCHDRQEVAKLTGLGKAFPRYTIGSCVVTCEKYSYASITEIVTKKSPRPIDLVYYGLLGYSEIERARTEKGAIDRGNYTTSEHFKKLGKHPLLSLVESQEIENDHDRKADLWIVGGAFVDLLIAEGGEDKFRELYESSGTEQSFENGISSIYGTDLETLEKKLKEKYNP